MPVRLFCDAAAEPSLCPLFAEAVSEAHPEWRVAQTGQAAEDHLRLVVLKHDSYGLKARIEWKNGNNPPVSGPEFELSVMDRALSDEMAKGFLLRLLDYSKVDFE
ncbi:hypothetical protein RYZ20_14735 [Thioclava sp. A2]|uniref:hypothetical protein n=1 Tax=Thioclava sp. FCG-A2 TaxID=3080562 RepID=UPI00295571CB|nr:hypothetical protein [Thioclava sp. A2]MDV7272149.1 hypothetical protein [Thioclava sp. A2]